MKSSHLIDNKNGSFHDPKTGLTWDQKDSWQREPQWLTWDEAVEYARSLCHSRFCGFNDWRMPTDQEALTLYDPEFENRDKYDKLIHLDPVFPPGSLPTIWLKDDIPGNDGIILDYRNGEVRSLYRSKTGRMATRPVRGD
jgi:hypothetical protein